MESGKGGESGEVGRARGGGGARASGWSQGKWMEPGHEVGAMQGK